MAIKLPFRLPNPITWRLAGSGALVALLAYWLSAGAFGFGSFVFFAAVLYALALQFSEWRRVKYSLFALTLTLGTFFLQGTLAPTTSWVHGGFAAGISGALAVLLFISSTPHRDPRRTSARVFGVALTFFAATLFFASPTPLPFIMCAVVVALLTRDEALSWGALRVGEGKLIGAAVGLLSAEIIAFVELLPLGPVRAGALTAFVLLLAREGLGEAYQGGLRRTLVFQGFAVFFALSILLFSSVPWTL